MSKCFLYWAKFVPTDPNVNIDLSSLGTKIGITNDPFSRMTKLGGGTLVPLDVVPMRIWEFSDRKSAELAEKLSHHTLRKRNNHCLGEWFYNVDILDLEQVVKLLEGKDVTEVIRFSQSVTFDVSNNPIQTSSSKFDYDHFWQEFAQNMPTDLPSFNHSTYQPYVLGASEESYVRYEYCVNGSRCSVGVYIFKEADKSWINKKFELLEIISDMSNYSYSSKMPAADGTGYVRIILPYTISSDPKTMRDEMYNAMRVFREEIMFV